MGPEAVARIDETHVLRGSITVPSVLRCGVTIAVLKVLLKTRGFGVTINWVRRRIQHVPTELADPNIVKRSERVVALAAALYPGHAMCLEQSLTLYYLLRRRGVDVKYCQGVQPHPFEAHAWVEYRGEVINDFSEHTRCFARLPDQLP
jgi:Transglutaminase-like superfamily